jgi:hypothetical protein
MALEIMLSGGKKFCHGIHHDLESIFYVLIWVCSHMEGPEIECSDPHSLPIREWLNMNVSLRKLGLIKLSHLADFEDSILKYFTPYWNDFKPYAKQLLSAFFPTNYQKSEITTERMLAILSEAVNNMENVEAQDESGEPGDINNPPAISQSYAVLNSKRNRLGQDVAVVTKRMRTAPGPGVSAASNKPMMAVQDFGIWKESLMVPYSE